MSLDSSSKKYEAEKIKIFLKIMNPIIFDKQYYQLDNSNQTFLLLDEKTFTENSNAKRFNLDQIFEDGIENSYIYEQITRDCVSDCLNGISYTYIAHGASNTQKNAIIFGKNNCYNNINERGLLPRFIESLSNNISNDKKLSDELSIRISYLCINDKKIIDLGQFIGTDLKKINQNYILTKCSNEIKENNDNLSGIKKVPLLNVNDVVSFLCQIFELFEKIERESMHLLSTSHFAFIIYINDNSGKALS
ncbi:MAG: hypothetical protein MJ252_16390, partial [archaeon]|nr:hypothetical protein [archaeon]